MCKRIILVFFIALSFGLTLFGKSIAPKWALNTVWYQIFPERFNNGDKSNDPTRNSLVNPNAVPNSWEVTNWESEWNTREDWEHEMSPYFHDTLLDRRYGGDLQGIIDRLDYLRDLGINGIYFNPLFYAPSLHKYDASSFHHIDPHFGPDPEGDKQLIETESTNPLSWRWTSADKLFLKLLREAKKRGIRVIIDGVWNHTGRDFFAFKDLRKYSQRSRYSSWYKIYQFDDPKTARNEFIYRGWNGYNSLPEFSYNLAGSNLAKGPKNYIFNVTRRWMDPNNDGDPEDGVDGWRLDVAEEIPYGFWQEWHEHVRNINPQAFTVAEIWGPSAAFIRENHFSAAMNYNGFAIPVKGWLIDAKISTQDFVQRLENSLDNRPTETTLAMQNLVDSHDTQRVASAIVNRNTYKNYKDDNSYDFDNSLRVSSRSPGYKNTAPDTISRKIWKLVALFQATYIGSPMIYYGTELGMFGADDPEDRMPAKWHDVDIEIQNFYRSVLNLRQSSKALRKGNFRLIEVNNNDDVLIFERYTNEEVNLVAINRGNHNYNINNYVNNMKLIYSTLAGNSHEKLLPLSASVYSY
ncbi:MAG: glycoside hydrolase family 13 protein [Verrucomicrobiota bacterium]|nr:glycoside hydrolase family 13 protein [Verrucomicrobiota bacterium]